MRLAARVLIPLAAAALMIGAAVILGREGERPILPERPALGPPSTSPTPTPEPVVTLIAFECSSRPAAGGSAGSPSADFETCTGSVRVVGPTPVTSLDVWVDSVDASGRPFFACRVRIAENAAAGAVLTWTTVCETQAGTSTHRVHFSDRSGTPVRTSPPAQ